MKSAIAQYGYLNARLRARLANIKDSDLISSMLECSSFLTALTCLEHTDFSYLIDVYQKTGDIQMMEKALLEDQINTRKEILKYLDSKTKEAGQLFLIKLEIDNLKNIIRIFYDQYFLKSNSSTRLLYVLREKIATDVNWETLINATSWDSVIKSLENTIYFEAIKSFDESSIKENGLVYFETELDKFYYHEYDRRLRTLSENDYEIASSMLHHDLELKNVINLIRYAFFYQMDLDKVLHLMLPGGHLIKDVSLKMALEKNDKEQLKSILIKKFPKLGLEKIIQTESKTRMIQNCLSLEKALSKEREVQYRKIVLINPFNFGLLLAYFFNYDRYENLLIKVLISKYYNWSQERFLEVIG